MISSTDMPSATMPTTLAAGTLVPRMQGTPPITWRSMEIRSYVTFPEPNHDCPRMRSPDPRGTLLSW